MSVLTDCPACGTNMFQPHGPDRLKEIDSEFDGWIPIYTTLECTVCGFKFIQFYKTSEWCSLLEHEGNSKGLCYVSTRSPEKPYNELYSEPPRTDASPPKVSERHYKIKCNNCGREGDIDFTEYPEEYFWIFYTCEGCGSDAHKKIPKENIVKTYGDWLSFNAWVKRESVSLGAYSRHSKKRQREILHTDTDKTP